MRPVMSLQARVETYAPVWDTEHGVFVSGLPWTNLTFEDRYRAVLDSVTTSSVEGALLYLQRDCIDIGADPVAAGCHRKNDASYIIFFQVEVAQPNAALAEYQGARFQYPEFCPFVTMENGACVFTASSDVGIADAVGEREPPECKQYNGIDGQPDIGPCVGAQSVEYDPIAPYDDAVWFSYPGSCVMRTWSEGKTDACREQYRGGLCPFGTRPDGVTCTFAYKILGFMSIDYLVGITLTGMTSNSSNASATMAYANYSAFCVAGNVEFHSFDLDKTFGLSNVSAVPFWSNPSSAEANSERYNIMTEAYNRMASLYNKVVTNSTARMAMLPVDAAALTASNPPCFENAKACYDSPFGCVRHSLAQVCTVCRSPRDGCVIRNASYVFPSLDKAPRSVSDAELRSGPYAAQLLTSSSTAVPRSGSGVSSCAGAALDGLVATVGRLVFIAIAALVALCGGLEIGQ